MQVEECFSVENISNDLFLIRETLYFSGNICNIWLSKGSNLDVVIDTGLGVWDLPWFLKSQNLIGEKPVVAIATHVHFDHIGGLHQFANTAIHADEFDDMAVANGVSMVTYLKDCEVMPEAQGYFDVRDFKVKAVTPTKALNDGDFIDQGDKQLEILHLPGHSKGSIALFDRKNGHLFSGDVIYDGMLIDFLPGSSVSDYVHSCLRLKEIAPKVNRVFPGHFRPLSSEEMVSLTDSYLTNAERSLYKWKQSCLQGVLTAAFKGRETRNKLYNSLYYGCCCFFVI